MALRTTYGSTYASTPGDLRFFSDSTQNAQVLFSSQISQEFTAGANFSIPVVTAATSGTNPAFGHLTLTGSSSSALNYYLAAPASPYGQMLTVKCLNTSTSTRQGLWASTDGSVTWDGTNQVAVFTSSGGNEFTNWFRAVSVSSQRWHLLGHSTTNLLLSTQSS